MDELPLPRIHHNSEQYKALTEDEWITELVWIYIFISLPFLIQFIIDIICDIIAILYKFNKNCVAQHDFYDLPHLLW